MKRAPKGWIQNATAVFWLQYPFCSTSACQLAPLGGGMGASLGSRERTQRQTASHSWEERAEREGGWVGQRNRRAALLCCPVWVRECTNGNQERMKTLSYPGNRDGRKSNVMAWRGKGNPGKCIQFQLLPRSEARPEVLPYSRCARE